MRLLTLRNLTMVCWRAVLLLSSAFFRGLTYGLAYEA